MSWYRVPLFEQARKNVSHESSLLHTAVDLELKPEISELESEISEL